jgi:hypothetical protein
MRTNILVSAMAGLVAVCGVSSASATTYLVTYSGTITSGYDTSGEFGNGPLVGDTYSLSFTVDPALGSGGVMVTTDGITQYYSNFTTSNSNYASDDTALFSINGAGSVNISNVVYATDQRSAETNLADGSGFSFIENEAFSSPGGSTLGVNADFILSNPKAFQGSLDQPFSYSASDSNYVNSNSDFERSDNYVQDAALVLGVSTVTLTDIGVSGVPEPSMWALMFAGMAMLGGMLRLARKPDTGLPQVA